MNIMKPQGATPSVSLLDELPARHRLVIDGETYFTVADAADLTGLSRRTIDVYNSWRRCGRHLGPRPTRMEGTRHPLYTEADLRAYMDHGWTGQPGEPHPITGEVVGAA